MPQSEWHRSGGRLQEGLANLVPSCDGSHGLGRRAFEGGLSRTWQQMGWRRRKREAKLMPWCLGWHCCHQLGQPRAAAGQARRGSVIGSSWVLAGGMTSRLLEVGGWCLRRREVCCPGDSQGECGVAKDSLGNLLRLGQKISPLNRLVMLENVAVRSSLPSGSLRFPRGVGKRGVVQ